MSYIRRIITKIDKYLHPSKYGFYDQIKRFNQLKDGDVVYSIKIPNLNRLGFWSKTYALESVEIVPCTVKDAYKANGKIRFGFMLEIPSLRYYAIFSDRLIVNYDNMIVYFTIKNRGYKSIIHTDDNGDVDSDYVLFSTDKKIIRKELDKFAKQVKKTIAKEVKIILKEENEEPMYARIVKKYKKEYAKLTRNLKKL